MVRLCGGGLEGEIMAKMLKMNVMVEPELKVQIEALAAATGVSASSFIRMLMMSTVASVDSAFAAIGSSLADTQERGREDEPR
jgi:hypothetical protein